MSTNIMDEIEQLREFFDATKMSEDPIQLDECTTITSPADFVAGHLEYAEANFRSRSCRPYVDRLHRLRQIIDQPKP